MSHTDGAEHIAWCKARALEYLDRGDIRNAVVSMISDLQKHPETASTADGFSLFIDLASLTTEETSRWIEGF